MRISICGRDGGYSDVSICRLARFARIKDWAKKKKTKKKQCSDRPKKEERK